MNYHYWMNVLNKTAVGPLETATRLSIGAYSERLACDRSWNIDGMEKIDGKWHKLQPVKCEFHAVTSDQLMSHYSLHRAWELTPVQSEAVLRGMQF